MANTAQNLHVAQRRHQILQILARITKHHCSTEYIHAMLQAPRWSFGSKKAKKRSFPCRLSAVKLDLLTMKKQGLVSSVALQHYDPTRAGPQQSHHHKITAWVLTDRGSRELK